MNALMVINNSTCGYIYIIKLYKDNNITYKIGITSNINERISGIKSDRHSNIIILAYGYVNDKFRAEYYLHHLFSNDVEYNCSLWNGGECFNLTKNINIVIKVLNNICVSLYINSHLLTQHEFIAESNRKSCRGSSEALTHEEYKCLLDTIEQERVLLLNNHVLLKKITDLNNTKTIISNEYYNIKTVFNLKNDSLFLDLKRELLSEYEKKLDFMKLGEQVIRKGKSNQDIRDYRILDSVKLVLMLSVELGFRRNDFIRLRVNNFNFSNHTVTFDQKKKLIRKHNICVPDYLENEIKMFIDEYKKQPKDRLFSESDKTIFNWFSNLIIKSGIEYHSFQSLYNTCIKFHRDNGWSPEKISQLLNIRVETIVNR